MSEVSGSYPPGQPCWYDLTVADFEAAGRFYGEVLGWEFDENQWGYHFARVDGGAVAAVSKGEPVDGSHWTTYLATPDVAATVAATKAAGGEVIKDVHEVPTGWMAILADPTGGYFGAWQGETFWGSERRDEPGAPCWAEASSRDPGRAGEFFAEVFGVETKQPFPKYKYVQLRVDGTEVGGILGYTHERRPNKGHAAWLAYFQVADTDATVEKVTGAGGTVLDKPGDSPFGRMAVVADPAGARFAVIARP